MTGGRTHYQRLGVAPDASPAELRAAYRALARRVHPDAAGGSAAAMADLNEAWRVLSDPARRAVYDASLRDPAGTPPASGARRAGADAPADDGLVAAHLRARLGRPPRVRGLSWMVLLGVLLAIFLFTAYAGGRRPDSRPGVDGTLQVGSCVAVDAVQRAREVPCRGPHDGIVVTVAPLSSRCPEDLGEAETADGLRLVCYRDP